MLKGTFCFFINKNDVRFSRLEPLVTFFRNEIICVEGKKIFLSVFIRFWSNSKYFLCLVTLIQIGRNVADGCTKKRGHSKPTF